MQHLRQYWWLFAAICIAALLIVQYQSARVVESRTAELHAQLADTQTRALHLTRRIGYGGLIHNFKNLVLRPAEAHHYDGAHLNAAHADMLIDDLEAIAAGLEVEFTLVRTRAMIDAYRSRLDKVLILHGQGQGTQSIDSAVRFDDDSAIREIDALLDELLSSVTSKVERLEEDALLFRGISMTVTLALCGLTLALLLSQGHKRRHLETVRRMNDRLEHSNAALTSANGALQQFAGMVSHDLRAPLRHIGFYSELIAEDLEEPGEVRAHVAVISGAVERMDRLMASLLEFTKSGFKTPTLAPIDIRELVESIVADLQPMIEAADATVELDLDGRLLGDRELLQRVLHNLLGNSLKYVHADRAPHIDVTSTQAGDRLVLMFSDNGIGVDPQFSERIFEPCERLHANTSEYDGTGIGLSLVRAIVQAHGGTVRLDTDYTNGTRIVVELDSAEPEILLRAA